MTKVAAITGITGQDGSYLAELLLNKNYKVIGLYRRSSTNNFSRLQNIIDHPLLTMVEFDITDPSECSYIFDQFHPDEFYNLAAQSHVATSFKQPSTTFEINAIGTINLLENLRTRSSSTKFYQASTSEMFGRNYSVDNNGNKYQDENTPLFPQSPYAVSKLSSHRMIQIYRSAYNLYCCSGILFNHESPRRGENFVTRKITKYVGKLANNLLPEGTKLKLGNIDAVRDWGHAKDYVYAMYLMLNQDAADDYVISTGSCHSVKEFLEKAFKLIDKDYRDYIIIDPELYRPAEVEYLKGLSAKAKQYLNWSPSIDFDQLVKDMVHSDIEAYKI
jgi:GDPmannose 4,6-dehydratase